MNREDIVNKIIKFVTDKNIIHSKDSINLDASLSDVYGMDSISLVEVIIYCEEEFGFEFDYAELDLSNFENINTLASVIMKRIELISL